VNICPQKKSKLEKDQAELQALTTKLEELEAAYSAELCGREDNVSLFFFLFFFFVPILEIRGIRRLGLSSHLTSISSPVSAKPAPSLTFAESLRSSCLPSQPERADLLAQLASLTTTSTQLKSELEAYGAADPIKMETKRQAIELAKEAGVLWTGTSGKKKTV
jgi:hypothetical protein